VRLKTGKRPAKDQKLGKSGENSGSNGLGLSEIPPGEMPAGYSTLVVEFFRVSLTFQARSPQPRSIVDPWMRLGMLLNLNDSHWRIM